MHTQYEHYIVGMPVNDFGTPTFMVCALWHLTAS